MTVVELSNVQENGGMHSPSTFSIAQAVRRQFMPGYECPINETDEVRYFLQTCVILNYVTLARCDPMRELR